MMGRRLTSSFQKLLVDHGFVCNLPRISTNVAKYNGDAANGLRSGLDGTVQFHFRLKIKRTALRNNTSF